jgi:hypothetical protein
MPNIKISELAEISQIPANTQNFLLVGVDTTPLIPVTRKVRFSMLYDYIDNLGLQAWSQANTATQYATSAGLYANSSYALANTTNTNVIIVGSYANSAYSTANTAATNALSAGSYANSAFIEANTALSNANTVSLHANGAFVAANAASSNAASASSYANSAYDTANTSLTYALASNANSMIIVTSQPNSPTGNVGDVSGLVYLSNVALYYCTGTYDGSSNIWSKITSTDSW